MEKVELQANYIHKCDAKKIVWKLPWFFGKLLYVNGIQLGWFKGVAIYFQQKAWMHLQFLSLSIY